MRMPNDNQTHQDREHQRLPDRGVAAIWLVFYLLVGAYTAASLLVSSAIVANIKFLNPSPEPDRLLFLRS